MTPGLLEVLSTHEVDTIHDTALSVLEDVGMRIHSEAARRLVQLEAGGIWDESTDLVRFPRELVEDCLSLCPTTFRLVNARGERATEVGEGRRPLFASGHNAVFVTDDGGRTRRPASKLDIEHFARLTQRLDNLDLVGVHAMPQDVDAEMSLAHAVHAIWRHCDKPLYFSPDHDRVMSVIVAMTQKLAGEEDLREYPCAVCQVSPTSPLQWEQGAADALMLAVRAGLPLVVLPEPFCGVSAPISLAGTMVIHHAETLSGVVLANLARPNPPVIYGSAWTTFDMRAGNVTIGSPESMLLRIAGAQLARHCHLPYHAIGPDTDSQLVDYQSATEKTSTAWAAVCGGVHVHVNSGMIGTGMTVALDQLVLDDELAGYMKRIADGIRVDRETLAYNAIRDVGPAGSFLTHDLTLALMRSPEHWIPPLTRHPVFESWRRAGSLSLLDVARARCDELLDRDSPAVIDSALDQALGGLLPR
ncbi:MAG: trimethylamine methyltransferase family protein [Armatimonadota bacterium]|nr:MAG: trimethylamine methyltransferase family protein [Armatimonadota bacterium]